MNPPTLVIGIESSGLHSNGYTLVNDMLWRNKIFYKEMPELLVPTTIYARLIQYLLDEIPILGMAHITGGGSTSYRNPSLQCDCFFWSYCCIRVCIPHLSFGTVILVLCAEFRCCGDFQVPSLPPGLS